MRHVAVLGFVVALAITVAMVRSETARQPSVQSTEDYQEECTHEGCSAEEVEELYESYDEECLNEGCSKEEVFELGGSVQGVRDMRARFERLGKKVDPDDFRGTEPNCTGTTTFCTGVLLWCNDHCTYPDGSKSSTYLCGGCIGFWW